MAVIGAGDFGRNHARVYRQIEGVELVGVLDTDPERATRVAAEYATSVLPDLDALAGHVDAVSVAVPHRRSHVAAPAAACSNKASTCSLKNRSPRRWPKLIC